MEAEFDFVFEAKKWYHIVLTHSTSGALHLSTVRLYVDGEQVDGHRFKYPKVSIALLLLCILFSSFSFPYLFLYQCDYLVLFFF